MLTTDQKGAIAESAIMHNAIKLGIGVYRPISDGERYDLILDLRPRLVRVQCKWANRYGDVIVVRCYRNRRAREGVRRGYYSSEDIDAFAAYCPDLDRCYFVPIDFMDGRSTLQLRLVATRNNQREKINWASDFEFAARLSAPQGAVAQLGERCAGSA